MAVSEVNTTPGLMVYYEDSKDWAYYYTQRLWFFTAKEYKANSDNGKGMNWNPEEIRDKL